MLRVVPVDQAVVVALQAPLMHQLLVVKAFPVKAILEELALILAQTILAAEAEEPEPLV
jgi:hypothetical protein